MSDDRLEDILRRDKSTERALDAAIRDEFFPAATLTSFHHENVWPKVIEEMAQIGWDCVRIEAIDDGRYWAEFYQSTSYLTKSAIGPTRAAAVCIAALGAKRDAEDEHYEG